MKIAITGATGFLGKSLAEDLAKKGHELYLHARSEEKSEAIKDLAAKLIVSDICDKDAIKELVTGADVVVHTVSNFRSASGPPESYTEINLNGTINTFERAREAGVKRFVHISTIGVLGDIKECPASETTEFNPGDNYQKTKLEAELYCRKQAEDESLEMKLAVIRPCSLYGPGDMRMLKMFRMLKKGTFFVVGACDANFHAVYIDDLIAGIELAIDDDSNNEVYIMGGDKYISLKDYITIAAHAVGAKYPWIKIPFAPMYALSAVVEFACVPFGIEPPIFRRRVKFYRNNRAFDISKAKRELGYSPATSLEEGMKRTVEWYKANGYL